MTKNKIVLVPFPFDDFSSIKVRPAVCLTDPIGPHHHVILAFITSQLPDEPLFTDVVLLADEPNFAFTGLRVSSTVRLHRLMTINTAMIQRVLGEIPPDIQVQIRQKLNLMFS